MQDSLFGDEPEAPPPPKKPEPAPRKRRGGVEAAALQDEWLALRERLPSALRLGTSSWSYPGWIGSVWAREYSQSLLAKRGLPAYCEHPLLRTVSLDRAFYQPLLAAQYAQYATQVPADFRFLVKAPSLVADAMLRGEDGRSLQFNASFLDPTLAAEEFAIPARDGLRSKLGALVFQLSPMPSSLTADRAALLHRLSAMLAALPDLREQAPDAVVAIEVRNPELLNRDFAAVLREHRATYCLGLHAKMPAIEDQLPTLRALWPGPLVCRWNLHRKHGAFGYEEAKRLYGDFNQIVDADPDTRSALARVIRGTTGAGHAAYVTLGNKAEGSAPLSVFALAAAVASA